MVMEKQEDGKLFCVEVHVEIGTKCTKNFCLHDDMCQIKVCLNGSKNEVSMLPLAVYVKILLEW
jgi:hypothetical protein